MDNDVGIIRSILDSNNDINYYYRTSKDLKFIKKIKIKKLRNHLIKIISNLKDGSILPYNYLKEFLEFIYLYYPPNGSYGHIASTKKSIYDNSGDSLVGSTVSYEIQTKKNKFDVICDILCDNNNQIQVSYYISMNNNPKVSFTESKSELMKEKENLVNNEYSNSYIATLARNKLIEFLYEDICNFLMDNINRSKQVQEFEK